MGIQVKHDYKTPGEYGYVESTKKMNFSKSIRYLILMLLIYFGGSSIFPVYEVFFRISALLLILPFSNFLARYFSFLRYEPLTKAEYDRLTVLGEKHGVLGELPIVRHKSVFFLRATLITGEGVYILLAQQKTHKNSEEQKKGAREAVHSILSTRGFQLPIILYEDSQAFIKDAVEVIDKDRQQKSEVLEELREVLITRVH